MQNIHTLEPYPRNWPTAEVSSSEQSTKSNTDAQGVNVEIPKEVSDLSLKAKHFCQADY